MSIVEGVGDEVVVVLGLLLVIFILVLAWFSTDVSAAGNIWLVQMHSHSNSNQRIVQIYSVDGEGRPAEEVAAEIRRDLEQTAAGDSGPPTPLATPTGSEAANNTGERESPSLLLADSLQTDAAPGGASEASTAGAHEPKRLKPSDDPNAPRIKLKFIDETQKLVRAFLTDTVGEFKRQNFEQEVNDGKVIRLIYNGQLLRDDSRSLESYGVVTDCVLHCHVSNTPLTGQSGGRSQVSSQMLPGTSSTSSALFTGSPSVELGSTNGNGLQLFSLGTNVGGENERGGIGQHIYLIFGLKFILIWASWLIYPEFFDFTSFFSLFLGTVVYLTFMYASNRRREAHLGDAGSTSQQEQTVN